MDPEPGDLTLELLLPPRYLVKSLCTWVGIAASLLYCVSLGKAFDLSDPQAPHIENKYTDNSNCDWLVEMAPGRRKHRAWSECLISGAPYVYHCLLALRVYREWGPEAGPPTCLPPQAGQLGVTKASPRLLDRFWGGHAEAWGPGVAGQG